MEAEPLHLYLQYQLLVVEVALPTQQVSHHHLLVVLVEVAVEQVVTVLLLLTLCLVQQELLVKVLQEVHTLAQDKVKAVPLQEVAVALAVLVEMA